MKIAFVDYYLDEWHANNYQRFFESVGSNIKITDAFALIDSPSGLTNEQWAKQNGVILHNNEKDTVDNCDGVMILAPDNPEQHFELFKRFVCFKKPIFIDKPFALTVNEAKKMYDLADSYGVKIFSSSALRFADELKDLTNIKEVKKIISKGPGQESLYAVHQLEMIVSVLAKEPLSAQYDCDSDTYKLEFSSCEATLRLNVESGYSLDVAGDTRTTSIKSVSNVFENLCRALTDFFNNGVIPFDRQQTLYVVAINEAMIKAKRTKSVIRL